MGRTLGEGSFAKVKYARNTVTGDQAAIKILDREKVFRHKMVEQVRVVIVFGLITKARKDYGFVIFFMYKEQFNFVITDPHVLGWG